MKELNRIGTCKSCNNLYITQSIREKGEANPLIFLPIINYVLLQYSKPVAAWIIDNGLHMIGTNDTKFMKLAFKLARDHFGFNPTITLHQFFSTGFAERKIMYTSELIKHVKEKHKEIEKAEQAKKKTFV